jgi:hypothetical protein
MKKITGLVLVVTIALLIIYDVIAIAKGGTEASISSVVIALSYKFPFFTFMSGVICGHLYWRMRTNSDTLKIDSEK